METSKSRMEKWRMKNNRKTRIKRRRGEWHAVVVAAAEESGEGRRLE